MFSAIKTELALIWNWLTTSKYTRHLESEIARYQLDNQRLLNALLESHGLPHVTPQELKPLPIMRGKMLPSQWKDKLERATMPKEPNVPNS